MRMHTDTPAKTIIARSLGIFWILDGLLQFQPQMFGAGFVTEVLLPVLNNQPAFLRALVQFGIDLWNINPPVENVLVAFLQIGIGILLFFPRSGVYFKLGAYVSVVWGAIIWVFGEGVGLLFTGSANFYTGAPGAALFYSLPAVFLLMGAQAKDSWFPRIVGWTFILGAALQAQSAFWHVDGIQDSFLQLPAPLVSLLAAQPVLGNALLVFLPLALGLLILLRPSRSVATASLVFLALVWWWGQDFGLLGTVGTGTSTDPNSAPLFALFLIPLWYAGAKERA